jgi:hypothetical protein
MKSLFSLIHQILVYQFEEIPFFRVQQRGAVEQIAAMFSFSDVQPVQIADNKMGFAFVSGIFVDDDGEHPILKLVIEDRRILLDLNGTSRSADRLIGKLGIYFSQLTKRVDSHFLVPLIKAEDSEVIVQMDFSADKLFGPQFYILMEERAKYAFSSDNYQATISPGLLNFFVSYNCNPILEDYRIDMSRKEFQIGPRPGFPLSEQVYYSKAPIDTESHLQLLSDLENSLVGPKAAK